jgi:hypothetical protein
MELIVVAFVAVVLLAVLGGAAALAGRAATGRQLEERLRTDGELEPIAFPHGSRMPVSPAGDAFHRAA